MVKLFSVTALLVTLALSVSKAQSTSLYDDAVQLAARLVVNEPSGNIPEHLIYSIEDALVAVAENHSVAAQAVSHKYNIHTSPTTNTSHLRIIVGKEAKWLGNLTQSPIQTMLPGYTFDIQEIETTDAYTVLRLQSPAALNMKFIANELSIIDDIWMVELPSSAKDGNDIKLRKVEEGFIITYSYKTGNCETGCEETHYWEFGVSPNGDVSFIGEHGSDLASSTKDEEYFFTLLEELRP